MTWHSHHLDFLQLQDKTKIIHEKLSERTNSLLITHNDPFETLNALNNLKKLNKKT